MTLTTCADPRTISKNLRGLADDLNALAGWLADYDEDKWDTKSEGYKTVETLDIDKIDDIAERLAEQVMQPLGQQIFYLGQVREQLRTKRRPKRKGKRR